MVTQILKVAAALMAVSSFATGADAKVVSQNNTGFDVVHQADVTVDPKAAYDAFVKVGSWWNGAHSYSGDAKNISIDAKAGGCWCETLPNGGSVRHMTVVNANPGVMLVFSGGLGPLQFMGVAGSMTIKFKAQGKGTHFTVAYAVGGYDADNFKDISAGVDSVLGEQIKRYAVFASTGKP
jgi:hypothetical protein